MRRFLPWIALLALASVPMWLKDPYLLNAFVTTGIFIVAAMSLNLLLGYTGQLSLGHVAFFGMALIRVRWCHSGSMSNWSVAFA